MHARSCVCVPASMLSQTSPQIVCDALVQFPITINKNIDSVTHIIEALPARTAEAIRSGGYQMS